jgi:hypothetical protein
MRASLNGQLEAVTALLEAKEDVNINDDVSPLLT